jgi:hypothetical protein
MTLPNQRTRAVISAAQFLKQLTSPYVAGGFKKIPSAVRAEALAILRHFPGLYELHVAARACPEVFDELELSRDEEEQQALTARMLTVVREAQSDDYGMSEAEAEALAPNAPRNRPTVESKKLPEKPAPDTSWMDAEEVWVDPPSGWRYGFPKIWNRKEHPDMRQWMIDNGYPEKLARQSLPVRFMSVSE